MVDRHFVIRIKYLTIPNLLPLEHSSNTLMIGENTNIGRRSSQPFERLEHIEPLEPDLYRARF